MSSTSGLTAAPEPRKHLGALLFLLALVPIAFVGFIINRYGVNVPYADEWSNLLLVEKWDTGQVAFADLIRPHNGHRILVPRLIYLAFVEMVHGNVRAEMFFSLFLCGLTSAGLLYLLRRTVRTGWPPVLALWVLTNVLLFSPVQAENWLWGFQFQIFLSNLCLVGAVIAVTANLRVAFRVALAAIFAVIGTFSFGNGLLIWVVVALLMIARGEAPRRVLIWGGVTLAILCGYFFSYHGKDLTRAVAHSWDYPLFFVAFLGAPLAPILNTNSMVLPVVVGAILCAAYFSQLISCLRRGLAERDGVWLALGVYPVGGALLAAAGRTHFGARQALDSRYTTVATILLVSLIGLAASLYFERPSTKRKRAGLLAAGVCLILYAFNLAVASRDLEVNRALRSHGKAALEFSKILDTDEIFRSTLLLGEDRETLARYLAILDRRQLTFPPRRDTAALGDGENRVRRSTVEHGAFENLKRESGDSVVASGWSYLPAKSRAAACVVFAFGQDETWTAFALSGQRENRPDLPNKPHGWGRDLGWRGTFSLARLPPGTTEISAWAVDADKGQTFRLPGSFVVEK
jgi:xanthosine utilization system XapX-like protein